MIANVAWLTSGKTKLDRLGDHSGREVYEFGITLMMIVVTGTLANTLLLGLYGMSNSGDGVLAALKTPEEIEEETSRMLNQRHHKFRLLRFAQYRVMRDWDT